MRKRGVRINREREDLTGERQSIVNKIDGILATLGIRDTRPCGAIAASN